jgi:D-alanine-D-alanine ligase
VSLKSGEAVAKACIELSLDFEHFILKDEEFGTTLDSLKKFDFVFIALHGTFGEDGTIQRILEENNIPFNGSNSKASKLCFDKAAVKILAKENDILTPDFFQIKEIDNIIENSNFSIFQDYVVKPNQQGSSLGIFRKKDLINDFEKKLKSIFELDTQILIEEFIDGREVTVGIMNGKTLPIIEIKPKREFYDFRSKYSKGSSEYFCPAEIESNIEEKLIKNSLKIHQLTGCDVYSRVDFRIDRNGNPWFLEINTLPGLTETSLFPLASKKAGINFEKMILNLINLSNEK